MMNLNFNGLLEPQKNHATKLLNSLHMNGFAFDASPTGTGKTYCASWIAKNYGSSVVVLCPKSVQKNWFDTLKSFGIDNPIVMTIEKLVRGKTEYYTFGPLMDYFSRSAKQYWKSSDINVNFPSNSLVIMDEVHKCKGKYSLNAESLIAIKNAGHKLLMLSASAATNVTEMKAFGYVTALHNGLGFNNFCKDNGVDFNRFGVATWDANLKKCKEGMVRIHNTLFDTLGCASRMNRKDFGDIFPDNQVIADGFDIGSNTDKLKEVYNDMEAELSQLDESSMQYSEHHFAIIMKARRQSELLKVPAMVSWIEDMYDEGVSPVVFINFRETLEAIQKRLDNSKYSGKIAKIVGGQTQKQRDNEIEQFQSDTKRICLVMIAAGAAGVSLHDLIGNYPRHTLINPSFSAINILQSLGRCHRANGKTPVIQRFFFANGVTIEERMRQRVDLRLTNLDSLNDGDLSLDN
jgi:superfamily II DNA or RNA helicase